MWDEWAKDKDHVELCSVTAREESEEISLEESYVSFKDISPEFVEKYGGNGKPRWINIIRFKDFYKRYDCPSVLPRNLKDAYHIFGAHSFDKVWISSEGINIPCEHYEWSHYFEIPTNFKVFETWFKQNGFEIELSGAGRILLKIIDSVGGIHGVRTFLDEEIIRLLDNMSHAAVELEIEGSDQGASKSKVRAKTVVIKKWKDLLIKLNHNSPKIAERHLRNLLNYKILKGGVTLQCPECAQRTWYSLDDLSDRVICERCLEKFDFPIVTPVSESNWHLRTIGPFSVENYAQGGYCVALSLMLLGGRHSSSNEMTWIPSFSIKDKNDKSLEADFSIFLSQGRLGQIKPSIIVFGECKTFNKFTIKDVKRMREIADSFPGAVIAFCTLRMNLTDREKKIIAPLARKGRNHFKAERWINPVLILTGIELFNKFEPPSCWKDKGAPYNAFAGNWHVHNDIQELCNATQQMHLGIESYLDWYEQKRQKRLKRLKNGNSDKKN
jgi:hypothetical protein